MYGFNLGIFIQTIAAAFAPDTGLFKAAMFVNPTVGIGTCIGATITIVIAGTIAGVIPAIKAARIRPIEALRAE